MWFFIALIVGGLVASLVFWLRRRNMSLTWYEWLIGAVGLLLLLFAIQNYIGAQTEYESTADNLFLIVAGLPAVVLLLVAWQLARRRQRAE